MGRVFVFGFVGGLIIAAALSAQSKTKLPAMTDNERRTAIEECIKAGGIPVPIAGVISSQGIGCAQPLGN